MLFCFIPKTDDILNVLIEPQAESIKAALSIIDTYITDSDETKNIYFVGDATTNYKTDIQKMIPYGHFSNPKQNLLNSYYLGVSGLDFYNSGISTGEEKIDYMLNLCKEYTATFIFALYTFGTTNLTAAQIKAIQLGYKKAADFKKLQLSKATQEIGDKLLEALKNNSFLSKDRFTGRFAGGLKKYYAEVGKDEDKVLEVINKIDKYSWNKHFTPTNGTSMEIKSYMEAFKALEAESERIAA